MKCKHTYKTLAVTGLDITFKCNKCGHVRSRNLTNEESDLYKKETSSSWKNVAHIHTLYHDYVDNVLNSKAIGYELMVKSEKWAARHPEVQIVRCDDAVHAGSSMVLIPHQSEFQYHGVSVVYIPQCTGEKPVQFFLYPDHRYALTTALLAVARMESKTRKKQPKEVWTKFKLTPKSK